MTVDTDILIVGGGAAGIAAAIAASDSDYKIILIERSGYLGGKATSAEVGTICGLYKFSKSEISEYAVNGFARMFADELSELSATEPLHNTYGLHYLPYNIEEYKNLSLRLVKKANVQLYLNAELIEVAKSNLLLSSVKIKTNTDELQINFKAVIDCSGDAAISRLADCPLLTNEIYQAAAQIFTMKNIKDISEHVLGMILIKEIRKAVINKSLPDYFNRVTVVQGSVKNNMASFKLSIPVEVTFKENNLKEIRETALRMIETLTHFLINNTVVFKNASLFNIAPEAGIRVGARPEGKYILTEEDILSCKKFDSAIATGAWPIEEWGQNKSVKMTYFNFEDYYQIPADCLKSKTIKNLFFAGRNISATDKAIASARVMGICFQTGYAAGVLAAYQLSGIPETIAVRKIQEKQILLH